ncbi:hypothetical protein TSUD_182070 [Trifolium subterraneum]|uniref:RNase H type-1 domain-containing protein n=1 Tax=Trifolium subterraneum TaxID=3900 RepID=A0A2Z6PNV6_TRISU|nr:hypothetical protein TSUD_182070 [Trifolium subterraneum]
MYDPWLRGNGDRWVSSPQVECVYDLFVKDLLLENYKAWDIAKIQNLFIGLVVKEIIATPLISSVKEDKMVWEEERNGCYSVKFGYNLAMRCIFHSNKHHVDGNWNDIWKAQSPHKTRHLLWRLCRGCLPTRVRLTQRYVDCELNCPVCDDEVEDAIHMFFGCVATRECWMAAGLSQLLENLSYQDGTVEKRVFKMCRNEDNAMIGRVASLFWCIWHNRNDKIWNDNIQLPSQVGRMVFAVWNEWFTVHQLRRQNIVPVEDPRPVRWEKPGVRWIKCNVDAAFVSGSSITSMGFCFRDTNGRFVAGLTQWQRTVYSIVEGEAWALLNAMKEAIHRGFERVQFESDSKLLVDAIHSRRSGNSEFNLIVNDITLCMSSYVNFEVKLIRRQANSVAHTLARAANSWASFH